MGKSAGSKAGGGSGGGGKGKSISGGGSNASQSTTAATSRFTPEEQTAIDNTSAKLRQLPETDRNKQIARIEESINGQLKDAYTKAQQLENTMKQYEDRNPGKNRTSHPLYNDYTKAQSAYEARRKDRDKLEEIKNRIK